MSKKTVELGDSVRDSVSGFTGIVTGMTEFLHGCFRCGVTPQKLHDNKPIPAEWFDEPQLVVVKAKVIKVGKRDDGGPMSSVPTRNSAPSRR